MNSPVLFETKYASALLNGICLMIAVGFHQNLTAQCTPPVAIAELSVNNIRASIYNGGDMWHDDLGTPKYEYPKGSGINALFAGGIWLSSLDSTGALQTAVMQYRTRGHDFFPGPIAANGTVSIASCYSFDRLWNVTRTQVQQHIIITGSGTPISINNISNDILMWPAKGNAHFTAYNIQEDLAPFVDFNNNGIYDPENGDYPHIKGDEALFWVMNDIGNVHTHTQGMPLGVEIHCMAYSYSAPATSPLNDATFYDYTIIKKTTGDLNDFYFGQYVDPDLGNALDDYVGCDTNSNTAFTYNGDSYDDGNLGYGYNIPMVSTTFLNKSMNTFNSFGNTASPNGSPLTATHYRNYMTGYWKDGSPITEGGWGYGGTTPTKFMYPGNPVSTSAWNETTSGNIPSDRRYVQATGPYTLNYGDVFEITVATVAHPANGNFDISASMLPRIAEISQAYTDSITSGNTYHFPLSVVSISYEDVSIYPNPVSNILSVDLLTQNQEATVALVDINGRTVHQENKVVGGNTLQIDMTPFTTGIYFLRVESNGSTNHYKVIKTNQP